MCTCCLQDGFGSGRTAAGGGRGGRVCHSVSGGMTAVMGPSGAGELERGKRYGAGEAAKVWADVYRQLCVYLLQKGLGALLAASAALGYYPC